MAAAEPAVHCVAALRATLHHRAPAVKLSRTWAMPSPETFSVQPIRELIERYINSGVWVDPFCRNSVFKPICEFTNDINPKFAGTHNMDALDFLKSLPAASVDGVLFDPHFPPSTRRGWSVSPHGSPAPTIAGRGSGTSTRSPGPRAPWPIWPCGTA